jgi:hypothetical protein
MTDASESPATSLHWLQHCGSWFAFAEPAAFMQHKDGGYFASIATGEHVQSVASNGYRNPESGLAPWAGGRQK